MLRSSLVALLFVGCSSSDPSPLADAGTDTGPITTEVGGPIGTEVGVTMPDASAGPGVRPPPRPSVMVAGGSTKWFAIRTLQLGVTRRSDGVSDANAWKDYGYDLDFRTTTRDDSKISLNSCKRREGSPTNVLTDGNAGRDNNFGQHVMSVIRSLKADAEDAVNSAIGSGETTLLLRLDNFSPTENNASVPGTLMAAGKMATSPKWDGTDKWSIVTGTSVTFPSAYMADGVWVSGEGMTSATVPLPFGGAPILLPLDGALVTFRPATGTLGVIAGATNANKLVDAITPTMKSFGICPGNATFEQVAATITQSADLVGGAPLLQDTSKTCDAVSVGLGFTTKEVAASDVMVGPPVPGPDECGPVGDAG
jgi:hypothetical protein